MTAHSAGTHTARALIQGKTALAPSAGAFLREDIAAEHLTGEDVLQALDYPRFAPSLFDWKPAESPSNPVSR